jgi:hypothetical protein
MAGRVPAIHVFHAETKTRMPGTRPGMTNQDAWLDRFSWTTSRRAFSSEVETGSREENASKQKLEPGSDSVRTGKALV